MKKIFTGILIFTFSLSAFANLKISLFSRFPHKWEYLAIGLIYGFLALVVLKKWRDISNGLKWILFFIGAHSLISSILSLILMLQFSRAYLPVSLQFILRDLQLFLHLPSKIYLTRVLGSLDEAAEVTQLMNAIHPLIKALLDFVYVGIIAIIAYEIHKKVLRKNEK